MNKTPLEHFQDIKEFEVADEQGLTVEGLLPYKCEQVEKSLKALEIIKEKYVDVDLLWDVGSLEEYNSEIMFSYQILTEEEFNLLREVLE